MSPRPRNDSPLTSWVSDTNPPLSKVRPLGTDPESQYPSVTAVEPRAFPKLGTMMDIHKEIIENRTRSNNREKAGEREDSFVFPLVLPGDWQASPRKKNVLRKASSSPEPVKNPSTLQQMDPKSCCNPKKQLSH